MWVILAMVMGLIMMAYAMLQICAYRSVRKAERLYPPIGKFIHVKGHRIHYVMEGSGPTIVLLHGAGGNLRDWTFSLVDQLKSDFTVIAFDRPGHGYTDVLDPEGETLAQQADLLAAALKLLGHPQAIILGYSFGGALALSWALNHPRMVRGLCLISAVSNNWVLTTSWLYDWAADKSTSWFFAPFLAGIVPNHWVEEEYRNVFAPQKAPSGFLDHVGVPLTVRTKNFRANSRQIKRLRPEILSMAAQYEKLDMPVEILHGTQDRSVPIKIHSDVLIDQIPHAVYRRLEGFGHGIHQLAHPTIIDSLERLESNCKLHGTCL
ncbi:MAG: alpha/beta hydrolase [Pseudomonadota bacterium]